MRKPSIKDDDLGRVEVQTEFDLTSKFSRVAYLAHTHITPLDQQYSCNMSDERRENMQVEEEENEEDRVSRDILDNS